MRCPGLLVVAVLLAVRPGAVAAQVSAPEPLYHGVLTVNPGKGTLDLSTGAALLKGPRWRFYLYPETNGIFPDQERILFAIGEETFRLLDGMLRPSRNGRVFAYRARPAPARGIRSLRLARRRDGSWGMAFVLQGVELSSLLVDDPLCRPLALIIGDDDFFNGVLLTRKTRASQRVRIPGDCDVTGSWPWIR